MPKCVGFNIQKINSDYILNYMYYRYSRVASISDSDLDTDEEELMLQVKDFPADSPDLQNTPPLLKYPPSPTLELPPSPPNVPHVAKVAAATTNGGIGTHAEMGNVASTARQSPPPKTKSTRYLEQIYCEPTCIKCACSEYTYK